jgi:hypothetical protein
MDLSHDTNIDALKHTRRAAMQTSWIWALLLAMALCASLAFFLIEVWQTWSLSIDDGAGGRCAQCFANLLPRLAIMMARR